jgi:GAF domain-containing protein/anti-sigma regulatory factor (Ser/Thr protein kinase)
MDAMASEVSTAGAQQDLHCRIAELERELGEAHQREGATGELLQVINRPQFALESVFDAIAESAGRLCEAELAFVLRFDGELISFAAAHGLTPDGVAAWRKEFPRPVAEDTAIGRAILQRAIVQIPDVQADPAFGLPAFAHVMTYRSVMAVPFLRDGRPIGGIAVGRAQAGPFPEGQMRLLRNFADQAVIAIENTRLFEAEQASKRELQESLEYQTAISDVLNIISRSPSELQPVVDLIVQTAKRLCSAERAMMWRLREGKFDLAAHTITDPALARYLRQNPISANRDSLAGRAALEGRTIHARDIMTDPELQRQQQALAGNLRTLLVVPLLRGSKPIGVLSLARTEVQPFTDKQVELVTTFADQAVIAIENTRLFEAEQASKRQLQESLEYQTAISDVLNVISRSPTDVQPVFDTIAKSAAQLCKAQFCHVFRYDGQLIHFAASHGQTPESIETMRRIYPIPPGRVSAAARSILTGVVEEISDIHGDPDYGHGSTANYRSIVAVPMLKDGRPVGAICMARSETGVFPERQIELLRTFADQAVIASENARLFAEVQARNSELRVALEQQTATSELLKVIGRSTLDLQPVFEALAENAVRLCEAEHAFIFRYDGQFLRSVATHNIPPSLGGFVDANPIRPGRESGAGRAAMERRTIHIEDIQTDPEFTYGVKHVGPMRTVLAIPMLLVDELLGVIVITRPEVRLFTQSQTALMETFADQAVIAIENTRLFEEVQARNRDLTALGEVGRVVSSTLDLRVVLKSIVDRAVELSGTDGGSIFYYRAGRFELGETTGLNEEAIVRFRKLDIAAGQTGLGDAIAQRQPLQVPDIFQRPSNPLRDAAIEAGLRAGLIVPLFGSEGPLGALVLQRRRAGDFPPAVVSLMQAFADQSAIALENARLFDEIAQKSRELEIASQHKSQFVANMSHELRTPLAAMLGYAELLRDGMFGEMPEKSMRIIERVQANGKHLLGLINTVLDISKIESGQFKLNLGEYSLDSMVETVRVATESLASAKKLSFRSEVATGLPYGLGDEPRLTQVLLNLVGNAIKFTDAGEVCISVGTKNGSFVVSVSDTGPGIPHEERERIFDKFHQVDSTSTRTKGGTGLGLAIAKEIIEMHGGRISVESIVGRGSTFRMQLPVRAQASGETA